MIRKNENWYVPWLGALVASRAAALSAARGQPNVMVARSRRPSLVASGVAASGGLAGVGWVVSLWAWATLHAASATAVIASFFMAATPRPLTRSEAVLHHLVVEGPHVHLAVGHHRRRVLGEVAQAVGRVRVAVKELLHLAIHDRGGVVRNEGPGNDRGVRITLHRIRAPDDAGAGRGAIRRDDEAAARHAARRRDVTRGELGSLAAERDDASAGEAVVVGLEARVLAPDIEDAALRPLHIHRRSVNVIALAGGRLGGNVAIAVDDRPVGIGHGRRRQTRGTVRRIGQVGRDERQVEVRVPAVLAEIVLVQVVENAVLAASDEIAAFGDEHDPGRAEILVLVRTPEITERGPEVGDLQLRFAVVHPGHAGRVPELDEALAEVAGHRLGVHSVPGGEIEVLAVDRRPRAGHPHP